LGDGVDILRALKRAVPVAALAVSGCVDFVAPDLPELGAPAVIEATIRLTDQGVAELDARLVPGLDIAGYRRPIPHDTIDVLGLRIAPDSTYRNGTRRYVERWAVDPAAVGLPARFLAPDVDGILATRPSIEWAGIRRIGADTIEPGPEGDVMLYVAMGEGGALPAPAIRQWFLRLEGDTSAFGISADGPPPDTIFVPARWIPEGETISIRLIFSQSAVLQPPPGDYLGLVTLDSRLFWTLRVRGAAFPAARPATPASGRIRR
jgi:hypothetical protein